MTEPSAPDVVVLCAHGTADPAGRQTVVDLGWAVARARPDLQVELAYVDVQEPKVADVVGRWAATSRVRVVPLLLSTGYHVQVDIADAIRPWPTASATGPLGPHPLLTRLLRDRLVQAGAQPGNQVVLAAAGSSRPDAAHDVEQVRDDLAALWDGPVAIGYGSATAPSVRQAVTTARAAGIGRVVVASYLLAPGYFNQLLADAGADLVTTPLGADPLVVAVVEDRLRE